jgi:hypothetical protein
VIQTTAKKTRRAWSALLAGASISLVGAGGASAAVLGLQDDRLASTAESTFGERLDLLQGTGARVTRVDVLWSEIAPTKPANESDPFDPAYRFGRLDQILAGLTAHGIVPILSIYSAPTWATGGKGALPGRQYNAWMPNPGQYGRFVGAVAKRYSGFVSSVYAVQPQARHIEIWNEGNIRRYFAPQFDARGRSVAPRNYMRLVGAAYTNAKAANPRSVIIAGAGGPKSTTKRRGPGDTPGHGTLDWIRGMRANKALGRFDAYSQHIYPAQPPKSPRVVVPNWASIPLMLSEFRRIRPGLKLYITEAGYTTKRTPIRTTAVTVAQQARYMRDMMNLGTVRSSAIVAIIWFNMQDNSLWPGGLYREDLSAKPSLAVFRSLAGRGALPAQLRP